MSEFQAWVMFQEYNLAFRKNLKWRIQTKHCQPHLLKSMSTVTSESINSIRESVLMRPYRFFRILWAKWHSRLVLPVYINLTHEPPNGALSHSAPLQHLQPWPVVSPLLAAFDSLEQHLVQHSGGRTGEEEWSPHHRSLCAGNVQ